MEYKNEYTREELIQLCLDSYVPFNRWNDRDSYSAQRGIQFIYEGLTGGVPYIYTIEYGRTIWIDFEKPTDEQRNNMGYMNIDSLEDYRSENPDSEMFDSGKYWRDDYLGGYMPTRQRLDEKDGDDWY